MNTDIHARGFALTTALREAVERQVEDLRQRQSRRLGPLAVRLFDVNGTRGGPDKGCLVHARLERSGSVVVATEVDVDLYRAIDHAFAKLRRGLRTALARGRSSRRVRGSRPMRLLTPAPGIAVVDAPP